MRDEFPKAVVEVLGRRVGFVCSNPSCGQPTSGPHVDAAAAVNIGVAAHITAASPGGPRYDSSLSSEERRSANNGIWACQSCAKLIDSDDARFTVAILREWKARAEHLAFQRLNTGGAGGRRVAVLRGTLIGHTNYVWDVVITPDGRRVLSASNDQTVRMWDIASRNCLATFTGHNAFVCSVAVSSDGGHLAAGAADGANKVWNLTTGRLLAELNHGGMDAKVAWGPGALQLGSGGADGRVRMWRLPEATLKETLNAHARQILKIVILDDGDRVVTVSADRTARVCRVSTGECIRVFEGHTGEVNSVAVAGDKRHMISASEDCTLKVWDIDSGECLATLRGHCAVVWRVAVSPDGKMIASGAADNSVRLWDLESQQCIQELVHPDCVAAVAFSPEGSSLAVGCDDSRVYIYSVDGMAS